MILDTVSSLISFPTPLLGAFPGIDTLFSTQGIMVMLLGAYAVAMWMFLTSAPKVYTVMVSDLELARELYEGLLELPAAEVPLHYYYNYEQTLGTAAIDPLYTTPSLSRSTIRSASNPEGLWYQLKKNTQLHIITGASLGERNRQRHVSFDRDCLEQILLRIQTRSFLKYKILQEKPLSFLVKDRDGNIIEMSEVSN
ncbi:glyoxalase-like domain protein [Kovacikia minuta CCNUW1]|uniref:glyoxalase-like domain protein n=1 Tax=Kovacikia minuta TaxID=2931930 RepID=UPI001CC9310A|nr:glyoxalase-like domain protein [Kovacikia minuta]UBF23863.1 glyoxalase-like domain protein [Kovacikia minuta CCNUW1]